MTDALDGSVGDKEATGMVEIVDSLELEDPTTLGTSDSIMDETELAETVGTEVRTKFMDPPKVGDSVVAERDGNVGGLVVVITPIDGAGVLPNGGVPPNVGAPVPSTKPGDEVNEANVPRGVGEFVKSGGVVVGIVSEVGEFVIVGFGDTVGIAGASVTVELVGDGVPNDVPVGIGVGAFVRKIVGGGVAAVEGVSVFVTVGPCVDGAGDCVGGSSSNTGINLGKYKSDGSRFAFLVSYPLSNTES